MAAARLDPRSGRRHADAVVDMVLRRSSMAALFRVSGRIHFHRSALAYAGGDSSHPGADARRRTRCR